MSLNHKRRIFRSNTAPPGWRNRAMPSVRTLLVAGGGLAGIFLLIAWFGRTSDAPARTPASFRVAAAADRVVVLDGETLRVGDQVVRLAGVDAPARGSTCHVAGATDVDCGAAAANALAAMVRGAPVACTVAGRDEHGRPVGECSAKGTRLNEAMVLVGWARAETPALREPEATARAAGRGIWRAGS